MALADIVLRAAPAPVKDLAVTVGSARLQRKRRSGVHDRWLARYRGWRRLPLAELLAIQERRRDELVHHARTHSAYYARKYAGLERSPFSALPLLDKGELQAHIAQIVVGRRAALVPSFTGGTTGRAITVYNAWSSFEERFALLDLFWETHGFTLGTDRVAWFSGRSLVGGSDIGARRFWRNNWVYQQRYYSTFHMSHDNLGAYVADLNRFQPQFVSGFPSAIGEVARFAEARGTPLGFRPRAIFVTSETLYPEQRAQIERVFGGPVRNQYSASEGAPFITECPEGSLHLDLTTGVVEVVDEAGRPSAEGEMVVTCFFTRETPIIRYRIGDRIRMAARQHCACGWAAPLVESLEGRGQDYVDVPGRGRIFAAQIGDCVKDVGSVLKFQVAMEHGRLHVDMVADREAFESRDRPTFLKKIAERMGDVPVDIHHVDDIPRAASGKHSLVRRAPERG